MQSHDFICYTKDKHFTRKPMPLHSLINNQTKATHFLQCYGFNDAKHQPVCEGDILILHITDELMNHIFQQ